MIMKKKTSQMGTPGKRAGRLIISIRGLIPDRLRFRRACFRLGTQRQVSWKIKKSDNCYQEYQERCQPKIGIRCALATTIRNRTKQCQPNLGTTRCKL